MTDIVIGRAALHAALSELRDLCTELHKEWRNTAVVIVGLNVLAQLFDPKHLTGTTAAAPGEAPQQPVMETPGAAGVERIDPAERPQGTPEADGGAPNAGTPPPPASPSPPMVALPSDKPAQVPAGGGALTEERKALLRDLWGDASLSVPAIHRRLMTLPGKQLASSNALYGWARSLGLPVPRPLPPEAPATDPPGPAPDPEAAPEPEPQPEADRAPAVLRPPEPDPAKAEAFQLFDAGQTVRDVNADLGTPLSTLSNWHAEWKLRTKGASA